MPGVSTVSISGVVGDGRLRGREETGVKRSFRVLVVEGASTTSIGTRRVRGFCENDMVGVGFDRFEFSSTSASTLWSSSFMEGLPGSSLRARRRS